jgi:hypothetical protein
VRLEELGELKKNSPHRVSNPIRNLKMCLSESSCSNTKQIYHAQRSMGFVTLCTLTRTLIGFSCHKGTKHRSIQATGSHKKKQASKGSGRFASCPTFQYFTSPHSFCFFFFLLPAFRGRSDQTSEGHRCMQTIVSGSNICSGELNRCIDGLRAAWPGFDFRYGQRFFSMPQTAER